MRRTALALALALAALAPARADELGRRLAEGYIGPATGAFAAATSELAGSVETFCAEPAAGDAAAREAFADVVTGWARIEFLRFGPLVEENRFERIMLWPDPRGIALRQVQALLAEQDRTARDPDTLRGKSVALQGLPALEFALFGSGAEEIAAGGAAGDFRCAYASAAATNLAGVAEQIAAAWGADGPMHKAFTSPGPDNDLYRNETEVAAEAIKALATGFEYVRDAKLLPALGEDVSEANPRRAPFWRTGLTLASLRAGVAGMRDFHAAGLADELDDDEAWIDNSIRFESGQTLDALDRVEGSFGEAVATPEGHELLGYVAIALKSLGTTVNGQLADALDVRVGFNALDGD